MEDNFDTITKFSKLKFKRCIVPEDAVNLDIDTLEMADVTLEMACAATYARFKRKSGSFSCQLVFAKTKIVPEGMSIPRAELMAASLNASTGHAVNHALSDMIKGRMHFTDSQIALCWISNSRLRLKTMAQKPSH